MGRIAVIALSIVLVAGCAPNRLPHSPESVQGEPAFPEAHYRAAQERGEKVFLVDADASQLILEVRRAGAFARLGHDHVVASHDVKGYVAPGEGRADLLIRLDRLIVDEAPLRQQAGFDTQPTPDDIAGTRHNMLAKVLESERYPYALVHIERMDGANVLSIAITLHGKTQTYQVPAKIDSTAGRMIVSGVMHFNQSDFGIVPYSVLNGALRVQDRLELRFSIVAHT
jgi:hypothetical protein